MSVKNGDIVQFHMYGGKHKKSAKVLHVDASNQRFLANAMDGSMMINVSLVMPIKDGAYIVDSFCHLGSNAYKPDKAAKALGYHGKISFA